MSMDGISEQSFAALAEAGTRAAGEHELDEALQTVAEALGDVVDADAVVVRVADAHGELKARSIVSGSQALAAELAGSVFATTELGKREAGGTSLPEPVARAARRARAAEVVLVPVTVDGRASGSVELFRASGPFTGGEKAAAEVAASQIALVVRAVGAGNGAGSSRRSAHARRRRTRGSARCRARSRGCRPRRRPRIGRRGSASLAAPRRRTARAVRLGRAGAGARRRSQAGCLRAGGARARASRAGERRIGADDGDAQPRPAARRRPPARLRPRRGRLRSAISSASPHSRFGQRRRFGPPTEHARRASSSSAPTPC